MVTNNINEAATELTEVYNRRKELEEFDNSKLGVKGLIDSGITKLPRIFHHPPERLQESESVLSDGKNLIPVIDMSRPHNEVVQQMKEASAEFGFFQVINHGIPVTLLERLVEAIKAFHELPPEEKMAWYNRNIVENKVSFRSNYDLFYSRAASWRDTLYCPLGVGLDCFIDPNLVPYVCRDEVVGYEKEVKVLGERLMGLLSEGLGLSSDRTKGVPFMGKVSMAANYYPHCPEPTKTVGIASHTDLGMFTILVQDQVGGLQVKYNGEWIDLKPVNGALVINLGDLFQIVSNDEYKSGEHRVVANASGEARASIAVFFNPGTPENVYGPLSELVTCEKSALYK